MAPCPGPQACQAFALAVALGFALRRLTSRCSALVAVDLEEESAEVTASRMPRDMKSHPMVALSLISLNASSAGPRTRCRRAANFWLALAVGPRSERGQPTLD